MKKYIIYLLLILSIAYLYANDVAINECKSDIYFANGIMTDEGNATKNLDLIWKKVLAEQYDSNLSKMEKELNFKTAYNETYGFSGDIYEAYLQLASESEGWRDLYLFISYVVGHTGDEKDWYNQALSLITGMNEEMIRQAYEADLSMQTTDYKNSIALGHSVIVVAHSQGNLFTNDAYKDITQDDGSWRKNYFTAVAVASPATKLFEDNNKDPHIGFENDPVAYLGTLGTTQNPNRSYKYRNALGELVENSFDVQFHSFDYYMGEDILFQDGIGERNVSTDIGKVIIMSFLQEAIQNHRDAPSQWQTDQEFDRNTCNYKITIKHRWDPSIEMAEKVYPFNAAKKLYQVNGEWVKASCGGKSIVGEGHELLAWDGKQDNECLMIDNIEEEMIYNQEQFIRFFVMYHISYHATADYPFSNSVYSFGTKDEITIDKINNEYTNDIVECSGMTEFGNIGIPGTYPFNNIGLLVNVSTQQFTGALMGDYIQIRSDAIYNILLTTECILNKVNKTLEDSIRLETVGFSEIYDFYYGTDTLWHQRMFGEFKLYYK